MLLGPQLLDAGLQTADTGAGVVFDGGGDGFVGEFEDGDVFDQVEIKGADIGALGYRESLIIDGERFVAGDDDLIILL